MAESITDQKRTIEAILGTHLEHPIGANTCTAHVNKAPQVGYGYGWNVVETDRDTLMLAHTGQDDLISHSSYLYAFPEQDVLVILLANASLDVSNETLRGIISLLSPKD